MGRALGAVAAGIGGSFLLVLVIAPIGPRMAARNFLFVLLTIAAGVALMAVVVRRTRQRDRLAELEEQERRRREDAPSTPTEADT